MLVVKNISSVYFELLNGLNKYFNWNILGDILCFFIFFQQQLRWPASASSSSGIGSPRGSLPPPPPPTAAVGGKYMVQPPPTSFKSVGYGAYMGKQLFPMDSVEAVTPVLVKRKRLYRADLSPVDPWKLFMSLR